MKQIHRLNPYRMAVITVTAAAAIFMAGCASTPPPLEQMAASGAAINAASSAGGEEFAPLLLKSAMDKMEDAGHAMGGKDYVHARQLAEQAQVFAQLAEARTRSAKAQQAVYELQEDSPVPD